MFNFSISHWMKFLHQKIHTHRLHWEWWGGGNQKHIAKLFMFIHCNITHQKCQIPSKIQIRSEFESISITFRTRNGLNHINDTKLVNFEYILLTSIHSTHHLFFFFGWHWKLNKRSIGSTELFNRKYKHEGNIGKFTEFLFVQPIFLIVIQFQCYSKAYARAFLCQFFRFVSVHIYFSDPTPLSVPHTFIWYNMLFSFVYVCFFCVRNWCRWTQWTVGSFYAISSAWWQSECERERNEQNLIDECRVFRTVELFYIIFRLFLGYIQFWNIGGPDKIVKCASVCVCVCVHFDRNNNICIC